MNSFTHYAPTELVFGADQLSKILETIKHHSDSVLVVCGGSFARNGHLQALLSSLEEAGLRHAVLSDVAAPLISKVEEGVALCKKESIGFVLGIGGGACMDVAKAVAIMARQDFDLAAYRAGRTDKDESRYLPVGMIPTYPSSGSEMNGGAQLTEDASEAQFGIGQQYPLFAWLNPEYIRELPASSLIKGAFSSFIQLSTFYVAQGRSEIGEAIAAAYMETILHNLRVLQKDPDNPEARENLLVAGALNEAGYTKMGKQLEGMIIIVQTMLQKYSGIDYKAAYSILFLAWIKAVYPAEPGVFRDYFNKVLGADLSSLSDSEALDKGIAALKALYREFGYATCTEEIHSVPEQPEELRRIAEFGARFPSVYRTFTVEDMEQMLRDAVYGF